MPLKKDSGRTAQINTLLILARLPKGFKPSYTEDVLRHFQTFAHPPAQACF